MRNLLGLWMVEIAGVGILAGAVAMVWIPAAVGLVGLYLVAAANVRGR